MMTFEKLLKSFPGGNRRVALMRLRASLKELETLVEAAINDEDALEVFWHEIVSETGSLEHHLFTPEEQAWQKKKVTDLHNPRLIPAVRERDGDICRYCSREVSWAPRSFGKSAVYSHVTPGKAATSPEDIVVACRMCDSDRDRKFREGQKLEAPVSVQTKEPPSTSAQK